MAHHHHRQRPLSLQGAQRSVMRLDAYSRHKKFVNDYVIHYGGQRPAGWRPPVKPVTDSDILRENHRFIRSAEDDAVLTWERRLAKKYYDKLFKEYAIADLSRYEEGAIGLRWRTEREVVSGKGQFSCGAKRCEQFSGLESYEVDFSYREAGEKKQALVKLRVCAACAARLNHRHARRKARRRAREERREAKRQRFASPSPTAGAEGSGASAGAAAAPAAAPPARLFADGRSTAGASRDARASAPPADAKAAAVEPPGAAGASAAAPGPVGGTVWSRPPPAEKTVGDEFDEYFDDLLQ